MNLKSESTRVNVCLFLNVKSSILQEHKSEIGPAIAQFHPPDLWMEMPLKTVKSAIFTNKEKKTVFDPISLVAFILLRPF